MISNCANKGLTVRVSGERENQNSMGVVTAAIGDAVITFMWIFVSSTFGALTYLIEIKAGVQGLPFATHFITTAIIASFVFLFTFIADAIGGASFNPTGNASFYAAGLAGDSLFSMALRFPAQAAGAVGGYLAINEMMPKQYKHMLGGPSLKVDLQTGAIAEGLLTFLMSFVVLFILVKGPQSLLVKTWMLAMSTVTLLIAGSGYTGPSMNPANAYGWAYVKHSHNTWDHFYVYWIGPFIGALLAGWVFRVVFPPPVKEKKA